jgi:hypothetical protein
MSRAYDHTVKPPHYNAGELETIEVMDHLPTHLDNAFKYLDRIGRKPDESPFVSAEKARWFLLRYAYRQGWITLEQWERAVGRGAPNNSDTEKP